MKRILVAFAFIVVLAVTVTAQTSSFSKGMYCLACCHQKCGDTCCKDGCTDSCCQSK